MKETPQAPIASGAVADEASAARSARLVRLLALTLLVALLASACTSSGDDSVAEEVTTPTQPSTEATSSPVPTAQSTTDSTSEFAAEFAVADCVEVTNELVVDELFADDSIECGYVTVPADWSDVTGSTIRIATYRIPSTSASPAADPVVYLEGGPGGAGSLTVGEFATGPASYLRERGDVIVVDQRGTGYSIPALYCPETGADPEAGVGHQECHDRFAGEGVDFSDYNSVSNAQDVNAVREALGYDEWNLYGLSYGTRLALTAMRDTDHGIRSVVLDSVFPIQVNGMSEAPYTMYWAIDQIADNCAMDADCGLDAKSLIEDGIERLTMSPAGDLDAAGYVEALAGSIAEPQLMSLITAVASGTDSEISQIVAALSEGEEHDELPSMDEVEPTFYPLLGEAVGMGYSVVCAEEAPYLDITGGPVLGESFRASTQAVIDDAPEPFSSALCLIWDVSAGGEIETQAVTSDIPTLILAGTADVATPPGWSELTGDTLANSTYLEFPGLTHGLLGNNDCLNAATAAFLDNPTGDLDTACVDNFPTVDYDEAETASTVGDTADEGNAAIGYLPAEQVPAYIDAYNAGVAASSVTVEGTTFPILRAGVEDALTVDFAEGVVELQLGDEGLDGASVIWDERSWSVNDEPDVSSVPEELGGEGSTLALTLTAEADDESGDTIDVEISLDIKIIGSGDSVVEIGDGYATIQGTLGTATYTQVQNVIDNQPEVDTLVMLHVAGSENDEINVHTARLIRNAGWTTWVPANGDISSGGVDMFIAGAERVIEAGAFVGVHSWAGDDQVGSDFPKDHPAHKSQLEYFNEMMGEEAGPDFYFYTLEAAPPEQIHRMTADEVDMYGLTTREADALLPASVVGAPAGYLELATGNYLKLTVASCAVSDGDISAELESAEFGVVELTTDDDAGTLSIPALEGFAAVEHVVSAVEVSAGRINGTVDLDLAGLVDDSLDTSAADLTLPCQ